MIVATADLCKEVGSTHTANGRDGILPVTSGFPLKRVPNRNRLHAMHKYLKVSNHVSAIGIN